MRKSGKLSASEFRNRLLSALRKLGKSDIKHQANYEISELFTLDQLASKKRIALVIDFLNDSDLL